MSLDEWLDECTMRWLEWERFDARGTGGMDEEQRRGLGTWIEACTQRWLCSVAVGGGEMRLREEDMDELELRSGERVGRAARAAVEALTRGEAEGGTGMEAEEGHGGHEDP